ncbi:MAG: sialidase family protein [Bacteroidota bacterium]
MSIPHKIFFLVLHIYSITVFSQHKNILISNQNSPEEVTICINPKKPNQVAAGANITSFYFSGDTGKTWRSGELESPYGVWGDPVIIADTFGHFYYFHLSNPENGNWIDRTVCQKSYDGGITWTPGTFSGLNGKKAQDKHWATVDPKTNNIYVTWTQFDKYGSKSKQDSTNILFTSSFDAGKTWTTPVRINQEAGRCLDDDMTVEGAVPCVGANGEIYVSWAGNKSIHFDKSLDSGKTWLANDILVSDMPGGWDFSVPGMQRCNGMPVTACDISNSPHKGTIYINWSDQRNGENNTDIWIAESTDGGSTWTSPKKVNTDTVSRHQFFTWMAIDQTNGNIYIVYYDRRNYSDNTTDVFLAFSTDGGETFKDVKISERSFSPYGFVFMGDYNNIAVYNNIIRPIWTTMDLNFRLSIWTAIIDVPLLFK